MSSSKGIVTVIGSGIVGKSWAIVFGRAGYTVHLFDVIPNAAQNALPMILQTAKELEQYGLLKYSKNAEEVVSRIKPVNSLDEALQGSQWSQECVPEDKESKKNLFQQLDEWVTKEEQAGRTTNIILASSTSAIPASVFTQDLKHKSRCIVAHPINPPHVIPLVEVVPAPWTDLSIVQRAMTFLEQEIAQSPVLIKKEVDSFIVNRLQGALLNEAFRLVEDGYISVDDLDKTMRDGLGLRWSFMGPFETIDMNAPGGVEDYINRYSGNMYSLAQQQSDARKWQGKVAEQVTKERRELLEVDQLGERIKWRNTRLMALMSHKLQQEQNDKKQ